jgi:hypothetical protein
VNVHAPTKDQSNDAKDIFSKELECVFDQLPKYHLNILLWYFNVKIQREDIFKLTDRKQILHETSNDNGVRIVNFTTSKNLHVKEYID